MRERVYCNRHQYAFLREVRNHPQGLPTEEWPAPSTLKRWLHSPAFRKGIVNLIATFRLEADLFSASAAARAGQVLQAMLAGTEYVHPDAARSINALARLIRTDHIRQRETSQPARAKAEKTAPATGPRVSRLPATAPVAAAPKMEEKKISPELAAAHQAAIDSSLRQWREEHPDRSNPGRFDRIRAAAYVAAAKVTNTPPDDWAVKKLAEYGEVIGQSAQAGGNPPGNGAAGRKSDPNHYPK